MRTARLLIVMSRLGGVSPGGGLSWVEGGQGGTRPWTQRHIPVQEADTPPHPHGQKEWHTPVKKLPSRSSYRRR